MIEIFGKYIFPLLLILGSLYLALREWVLFRHLQRAGAVDGRAKKRLTRRMVCSVLIIAMAVMILYGLVNHITPTRETILAQLNYWLAIIGLAFGVMILALWDVYDGIKNLERIVDQSSLDSLKEIQDTLRNSKTRGVQL